MTQGNNHTQLGSWGPKCGLRASFADLRVISVKRTLKTKKPDENTLGRDWGVSQELFIVKGRFQRKCHQAVKKLWSEIQEEIQGTKDTCMHCQRKDSCIHTVFQKGGVTREVSSWRLLEVSLGNWGDF